MEKTLSLPVLLSILYYTFSYYDLWFAHATEHLVLSSDLWYYFVLRSVVCCATEHFVHFRIVQCFCLVLLWSFQVGVFSSEVFLVMCYWAFCKLFKICRSGCMMLLCEPFVHSCPTRLLSMYIHMYVSSVFRLAWCYWTLLYVGGNHAAIYPMLVSSDLWFEWCFCGLCMNISYTMNQLWNDWCNCTLYLHSQQWHC